MPGIDPADIPEFLVIGAFRYALGRMSYVVGETCDWLVLAWDRLPEGVRGVIRRDLEEAFARDDRIRAGGRDSGLPLGMDMDRRQWERVARAMGDRGRSGTVSTTQATIERPILLGAPWVRAILDGRKTQTRRVVKPQPYRVEPPDDGCGWRWEFSKHAYKWGTGEESLAAGMADRCPYATPGDRLWVRETWQIMQWTEDTWMGGKELEEWSGPIPKVRPRGCVVGYRADNEDADEKWRPSIFMPRWASRITLEVAAVRVERVRDLTEADARAEGVASVGEFRPLWDDLHARRGTGWDTNPWVWAITFRRIMPS